MYCHMFQALTTVRAVLRCVPIRGCSEHYHSYDNKESKQYISSSPPNPTVNRLLLAVFWDAFYNMWWNGPSRFFKTSSISLCLFGSPGPLLLCGLSPRAASSTYSLAAVPRFLLVVASLIVDHGL